MGKHKRKRLMENVRPDPSSAIQESCSQSEVLGFDQETTHLPTPKAQPETIVDNQKYYTKNGKPGVALIFNHNSFKHQKISRNVNKDCRDVENALKKLNFDTRVHNDLKYSKLVSVMKGVAKEDHAKNDCIVIVVMTHGVDNMLWASDKLYCASELYEMFAGDKCKSLKGKPKIFLIQACRAQEKKLFTQCTPYGDCIDMMTLSNQVAFCIPQMTDLLVMFSSIAEYVSGGYPVVGTFFIQALCKELNENGLTDDLLSIMTRVARHVAIKYEAIAPNCKEQILWTMSMLTYKFYFADV